MPGYGMAFELYEHGEFTGEAAYIVTEFMGRPDSGRHHHPGVPAAPEDLGIQVDSPGTAARSRVER